MNFFVLAAEIHELKKKEEKSGKWKKGFCCLFECEPAAAVSRDCWLGRSSQHGAPPGAVGVVCKC